MLDHAHLILAIVEITPPLRVYLENAEDARRLADETSQRVSVVYEPGIKRHDPIGPAARAKRLITPISTIIPPPLTGSLPEQVRARINADPTRTFRVANFADLGDKKRINAILFRLKVTNQIDRPSRGEFRARRGAAPAQDATAVRRGLTGNAMVLGYMRDHAGEWLRTMDVVRGMGFNEDRRGAVGAALGRLADEYLQKKGGSYCYPRPARPEART